MILIIYAHPWPTRSQANKRMLDAISVLPDIEVRSLYDRYPDFNIDIVAEQAALARASLVIWQHPMQWYSVPPLFKLWLDSVLSYGWAYGEKGTNLQGKALLWSVTTGGGDTHFNLGAHPGFDILGQPLQATADYCGMEWLEPFVVHDTFISDEQRLDADAQRYFQRLKAWQEAQHG